MSAGSRKGALVFGLFLIGIGLAFFLSNWYSTFTVWQLMARYWPLLLILIGGRKLYGYFTWQEPPAPADPSARRPRRCCPSLLAGLIWTLLGIVFLLKNFGIGPDLWSVARRYWPILLILLGLGKIIDYYRQKDGVSIRFGEVFGIFFVLIVGLAISQIPHSAVTDILSSPITIGDTDITFGSSHEYSQDFTYPLRPGVPLLIDNSNGSVTVSPGSDGEVRIHMRKRIFEDDESKAKQIAGEIKVEGGEEGKAEAASFLIRTNRDQLSGKNYQFKTDLEVLVPQKVQLEVRNPFGGVNISGLNGKLNAQSSHVGMDVHDCSGTFLISNSSGEARLTNLTGNLTVNSGGSVTLQTIKGDVDIHGEHSTLRINDIEGKLTVADEDGTIEVDKVSMPVVINGQGSSITVSHVADNLRITNSHRRVNVTDVNASIVLTTQYATAQLKRIKGNVDVDASSGNITLEDIGGYVKATGTGTYVNVNRASGPVDILTSLKDVIVNNFAKGCRVTNERGDVSLSTTALGKDPIVVKNRYGDITLILPPNALFQLEATTHNGHIKSDFAGLEPMSQSGDITTIRSVRLGGPKILLETENNDIFVRTREIESSGRDNK